MRIVSKESPKKFEDLVFSVEMSGKEMVVLAIVAWTKLGAITDVNFWQGIDPRVAAIVQDMVSSKEIPYTITDENIDPILQDLEVRY
jgi:hypothetical protein